MPERERLPLAELGPGLSLLAESVLVETSRVDQIAIDAHGGVHAILYGEAGADAALLVRGIAAAGWIAARLPDWVQLAPGRGIDAQRPVSAILVCPAFEAETRSAARALPSGALRLIETAARAGRAEALPTNTEPVRPLSVDPADPGDPAEALDSPNPANAPNPADATGQAADATGPPDRAAASMRHSSVADLPIGPEGAEATHPAPRADRPRFRTGLSDSDLGLAS